MMIDDNKKDKKKKKDEDNEKEMELDELLNSSVRVKRKSVKITQFFDFKETLITAN